jgi:hypothetical protein
MYRDVKRSSQICSEDKIERRASCAGDPIRACVGVILLVQAIGQR